MELIALDLDGTTLNSNKEISKENLEAIKKAQEQGHIVMALSGRAIHGVQPELEKYGLTCHVGANNGASLYVDNNLVNMIVFKPVQFKQIILELEKEYIPYNISTNKGVFAPKDWGKRLEKVLTSGVIPEEHYQNRHFKMFTTLPEVYGHNLFDHAEDIINDESFTIQKFLVVTLDPIQKKRVESLLDSMDGINLASSSINLDIMHQDANKGNALKWVAEYFHIPLKDTVAIGDESNDISMLSMAGLSIAMGNANDDVKECSDVVTLSNDEHGVAHAINKYVLNI